MAWVEGSIEGGEKVKVRSSGGVTSLSPSTCDESCQEPFRHPNNGRQNAPDSSATAG